MGLKDLTKNEKGLLLYLETRAVDCSGKVDSKHMDKNDFELAHNWVEKGFIVFDRIDSECLIGNNTHLIKLSNEAWDLAHQERKARAERMFFQREK